jgi:hypothetical protein
LGANLKDSAEGEADKKIIPFIQEGKECGRVLINFTLWNLLLFLSRLDYHKLLITRIQ